MSLNLRTLTILSIALWTSALTLFVVAIGVIDMPILLIAAGLDGLGALTCTWFAVRKWIHETG